MTTFHNGILDIPGLMPVDIGSSKPYPVPSWPKAAPQAAPSAPASYQGDPGMLPGSVSPGFGNISGFRGPGEDGTGVTLGGGIGGSGLGDAQFATMGMNFAPDFSSYSSYAPQVHPAQSVSSFGSLGLGGVGQSIFDRLGSIGNTPHISNGNLAQAGINAAGIFSPLAPLLAGIGQGFNLWDAPNPTGNALADIPGTPGMLQTGSANIANWINRQFGGDYMPFDIGQHTAQEPGVQDALQGLANPYSPMAPAIDSFSNGVGADPNASSGSPIPGTGEAYGGGDFIGTGSMPPDPFFSWGGNVPDMGGAGIFNSIGATPWGGMGFGGGGPSGDYMHIQPDNNGGWGQ